ncbi:hypothetical protein ACS0TY_016109 [Phlomoides rotata]
MGEVVKYGGQKRKYVNEQEDYGEARGFVNHCRPRGIYDLVKNLNNQQLEAIKSIGFGGLLKMILTYVPVGVVRMLVWNFNGVSRMMNIGNRHSFLVTKYDICDVFLLPRQDGNDVVGMKRNESLEIMAAWKEKYGIDRVCSLCKLKNVMEEKLADGGDDFKRFFVLYCLSSFLTPTVNGMVDFNAVKSLLDVDKIVEVDWCSYVLNQLCRAVTKYNNSLEMKNVKGCTLVLLILYFHRLVWRGKAEPCSLPLIQHWNNEKLRRRVTEEMSVRGLGQGEWVEDVYPITLNSTAKFSIGWKEVDDQSRFIKFELPMDEPSDSDIHKIAADDVHECFLMLRRDMSVVVKAHMNRLSKLKEKLAVKRNGNQNECREEERGVMSTEGEEPGAMVIVENMGVDSTGNGFAMVERSETKMEAVLEDEKTTFDPDPVRVWCEESNLIGLQWPACEEGKDLSLTDVPFN